MNKFGAYISSLMTTVIDIEQEEFVKQLAWDELIIKNALDSMYDKLEKSGKFNDVKDEFEAIAGIVENSGTWEEVA